MEQIPCPHCQDELQPYDRRDRKFKDEQGDWKILVIRRLRCRNPQCRRIHAELPDILVPYKRYGVCSIQAVLTGNALAAPAEESTRWRWKDWYIQLRHHFLGVARSIWRHQAEVTRTLLASPTSIPTFIWNEAVLSLAELVRLTVNSGNWLTTRSAMVTGPLAL